MNNPHSDYVIDAEMVAHSLTQDEAQRKILWIYDTEYLWLIGGLQNKNEVMGSLPFYLWLYEHYPELLDFPDMGDRYQTIACWISAAERGQMD